jgi:hypothetical protein
MTCSRGLTEPAPTPRFVHSKQPNQPSNAMRGGMGVPQGVPKGALRYKNQNVRRHRHDRGTSTPQAHCHEGNRYTWANTAARPYGELINVTKTKAIQPCNAMRDGMWNGRASRRTQMNNAIQEDKTSAGIGTTVEHPRRKRIETASIERASKCVTTGEHSGPPLRRVRQRNQNQSNLTSQPTRCALKQHPSKELRSASEALSLGQPLSSSHPQYESHDPPHAPGGHHA